MTTPPNFRDGGRSRSWPIAGVFLALTSYFIWLAPREDVPLQPGRVIDASLVRDFRPRVTLSDPPLIRLGGFLHRCNDCHRLFQSHARTPNRLMQHRHIDLRHGLNNRCFNCHANADRERLVLRDGSTIRFGDAPSLCAECHGTTYRDWQQGMHGKTLGAWDPALGAMQRLTCTECHDPHAPAYPDYEPLPGPNTLRMGHIATHEGGESERHRPLSPEWLRPDHAHRPLDEEVHP